MLNALKSLLTGDIPPNKVIEKNLDLIGNYNVLQRDDSMVLYAPPLEIVGTNNKTKLNYEIVLFRPASENVSSSYSLFRAQTQDEALGRFEAYAQRVPNFVQMVKEMYNVQGLQKICDILTENSSWSIAHLVAHFNLVEYLSNPQVVEMINYPDHIKYMTPFQLAIKSKNIEMVKILISSAKLDHLDYNSSSIFHYAANTSKEMINILASKSTTNLNHCNLDGYTPLHAACISDNPDCVNALLCAGADVNITARHVSNSLQSQPPPSTSTPGCHFNKDYNGIPPPQPETPEQREAIQQVLASTSQIMRGRTSLPNIINQQLKATREQPQLIDTTAEQKGASVMDALLGMFTSKIQAAAKKEISHSDKGTSTQEDEDDVNIIDEDDITMSEEDSDTPVGSGRLLCLDGGGIRGLVLVQMLLEIEQLAQCPISHLFDWIAGTSTGGILTLGIGAGKTMKQCMCLYFRIKEMAFIGSRPYPSDALESVLKENLGEDTVMADIKHPKIMVAAVVADRKPVDLHLFKNYKSASDILGIVTPSTNTQNELIWRVARATGAAPSYFRAFGRFLDGGLIANNPTLDALTEIHEYNMALMSVNRKREAVPVSVVVSLGTGLPPVTALKEIDVFRPDSIWDTAKLAYGISAIGNLLVDQATLADGRVIDRARAWCSMIGVPYFRFNPQLSVDHAMDEKMDDPLINMMWETKAYMYQNRKKVIEMINLLK
ncbi:CLUMA_CG018187, isoform A [Clunio marinus]|uniref:phospholipase A2 n=1 Tax=Clunio marinus TaxID=568069 RepID=A0A1J1J373_9DIPT|nr:CLUMA_CG018187, isoform A [Clunio marinus]